MSGNKFEDYFEYISVRVIVVFLQHMPYRLALCVGWLAAGIGFITARGRVREAGARIREIFGFSISTSRVRSIAWLSWRNFIFSVIELIRIPTATYKGEKRNLVIKNKPVLDTLKRRSQRGEGSIIVVFHMGSWEMSAIACQANDIPLFSLAAEQKNRLVSDYINRLRQSTGLEIVVRDKSALKKIIRNLKEGKVLAILPDVRARTEALGIHFLGKTANVPGGMGFISRQVGVPLFPCVITRKGWMMHEYEFVEPIWPDLQVNKQSDSLRMTQAVFDVFEQRIKLEPEQWFWYNKRWLFEPL